MKEILKFYIYQNFDSINFDNFSKMKKLYYLTFTSKNKAKLDKKGHLNSLINDIEINLFFNEHKKNKYEERNLIIILDSVKQKESRNIYSSFSKLKDLKTHKTKLHFILFNNKLESILEPMEIISFFNKRTTYFSLKKKDYYFEWFKYPIIVYNKNSNFGKTEDKQIYTNFKSFELKEEFFRIFKFEINYEYLLEYSFSKVEKEFVKNLREISFSDFKINSVNVDEKEEKNFMMQLKILRGYYKKVIFFVEGMSDEEILDLILSKYFHFFEYEIWTIAKVSEGSIYDIFLRRKDVILIFILDSDDSGIKMHEKILNGFQKSKIKDKNSFSKIDQNNFLSIKDFVENKTIEDLKELEDLLFYIIDEIKNDELNKKFDIFKKIYISLKQNNKNKQKKYFEKDFSINEREFLESNNFIENDIYENKIFINDSLNKLKTQIVSEFIDCVKLDNSIKFKYLNILLNKIKELNKLYS